MTMSLSAKPVQMLLAVAIAVVLGPPIGALAVFLSGFGMYAADGYPWGLSLGSIGAGAKMLLALVFVAYVFAAKIALAAGILVAIWMIWRPPNLTVAIASAATASLGYAALARNEKLFGQDNLVTLFAALVAATGCWLLTRRFVRPA